MSEALPPKREFIDATSASFLIGDKMVDGFQDAKGLYYINQSALADTTGTEEYNVRQFFKTNHFQALLKAKNQSAFPVKYVVNPRGGKPWAVVPSWVYEEYILYWEDRDNAECRIIVREFFRESLSIRLERAFVGVSPNVSDILDEGNERITEQWSLARRMGKSIHPVFQQVCVMKKYAAHAVHNRMTQLVFGQTAKQAIEFNQRIGEDPTIGLDHQADARGQERIAEMKARFIGYRKGTWEEQVQRAFDETVE